MSKRFQPGLLRSLVFWGMLGLCSSCTTTQQTAKEKPLPPKTQLDEPMALRGNLGVLSDEQADFSKALAHYVSGLLSLYRHDDDEALVELEKVVTLDPSRSELLKKIVQECFRKNDFKKASAILEKAVQRVPDSAAYWIQLANAYRSDKQWEKSVAAAEKATQLDPTMWDPYEVLVEIQLEQQKLEEAKKTLDRASRQKSEDPYFWIRLATYYTTLGARNSQYAIEEERILSYCNKAIELQPKDMDVLARVADFYITRQKFSMAVDLYQKILVEQPTAEQVRRKLALCYIVQGEKKKAIDTLDQVVRREPFNYQALTLMGELYEELKDIAQALSYYRLALSANPGQKELHLRIVLLELKSKHPKEALKELDIMQANFQATPQINYFYGLAYNESKEYGKALEFMEKAWRAASTSNPEMLDGYFYFYYGAALERNGRFEDAEKQFRKALEIKPDYADAYNYLGFMYADKNIKLTEAMQFIEKALAYEPENGAFIDSLGWIYFRQGDLEKALLYLQRASKITGDDPEILNHIGDVYYKMGKQAEALQHYQKARDLDPKNKDLNEKLEKLKKAQPPATQPAPKPEPELDPVE